MKNSKTNSYVERTRESNVWGNQAHIAIHTNAASVPVSGTRIFTYSNRRGGCRI